MDSSRQPFFAFVFFRFSNMSSVNSIKVSLANEEQWREFHPETEMIVTKTKGRVLFPHLDFRITGLDAEAFYTIHLHLERTDQIK